MGQWRHSSLLTEALASAGTCRRASETRLAPISRAGPYTRQLVAKDILFGNPRGNHSVSKPRQIHMRGSRFALLVLACAHVRLPALEPAPRLTKKCRDLSWQGGRVRKSQAAVMFGLRTSDTCTSMNTIIRDPRQSKPQQRGGAAFHHSNETMQAAESILAC
eukprot:scaffold64139_cov36-Prasinocladus_malaysianus.AAC.1